ncbi:hydrogenase-4 component B [Desulfonispora thiosulfatigenes DSM 11270]|uniref:Hydrogenase-4 component B n=1 Tax=Desulfonispora thiosulfatigenes DSM 11270 TaxID=656914 RepID=A0A1W1VBQ8_DESTI|nr:proton-conducting transporter membrane subunit [Desulfonispora thiosulfatigenes]SMB90798.1 hydrogenase-4 component B [Desulfonispora thiosulfatigenes DSM 11270]
MFLLTDNLSIFFAFLICFTAIPVWIYSIGFVKQYSGEYSIKYILAMTLLFILSMLGVALANNSIVFLVFWELMSTLSFFLVIYEYKKSTNITSGIMYFIMTHISGLFLMVMFACLYKYTGSFEFSEISQKTNLLTSSQQTLLFFLALFGFGAKAGLLPFHAWIPKAYPAAPSNVSALMSSLMAKMSIYGFIRVCFDFIGDFYSNLGLIVMIVGIITAIYSILNALMQKDIKRLLSYSSAEHVGIIFAAIGLSIIFKSENQHILAIIALSAALFHSLNHTVFKSILFMSVGSVIYSTGTQNMDELGGLQRKMKFATYCAFIGTIAVSSLPPLNGFASEVLIFKSFISALNSITSTELIFLIIGCGILLALTSAGAMYAAVKSFGITYLGEPRTSKAIDTHKIPPSMNSALGITSLYALLLGLFAPLAVNKIANTVSSSILQTTFDVPLIILSNELTIVIFVFLAIVLLTFVLTNITNKRTIKSTNKTWACGFNNVTSKLQYSGDGFSQPLTRVLGNYVGYKKEISIDTTVHVEQKTIDIIETYIYKGVISIIYFLSKIIDKVNYGRIQLNILYIFVSLIVTLILVINFI